MAAMDPGNGSYSRNLVLTKSVSPWEKLPINVIENIMSYLGEKDKIKASLVNSSWGDAYQCPRLWKKPVFRFGYTARYKSRLEISDIVCRFGFAFEKLTILYRNMRRNNRKAVIQQIDDFLKLLISHDVQIKSLQFPKIGILCKNYPGVLKPFLHLTKFLRRQKDLRDVDLRRGKTNDVRGVAVLYNMQASNIEKLNIGGFFRKNIESIDLYQSFAYYLRSLKRVEYIQVSYRNMWGTALRYLEDTGVRVIVLKHKAYDHRGLIEDSEWIYLHNVEVHFVLSNGCLPECENMIKNVLTRNLPLSKLCFSASKYWNWNDNEYFCNHLCELYSSTLKILEISMKTDEYNTLVKGIIKVATHCMKLESLTLLLKMKYFDLPRLLQGILSTHAESFKRLRIVLNGIQDECRSKCLEMKKHLLSKYEEAGITLTLRFK